MNIFTANARGEILLVEKDITEVEKYKTIFSDLYNLTEAVSGKAALEIAESKKIDIVLICGVLEDIDIVEFCHKIRENPKIASLPVVLLCEQDEMNYVLKALNAGADGYFIKPTNEKELIAQINQLIEQRKPQSIKTKAKPEGIKTILLTSNKGGTGVSTIVANWGYALSKFFNKKVLLIDAAGYTNHLSVLLGVECKNSLSMYYSDYSKISKQFLNDTIVKVNNNLGILNLLTKISDINKIKIPILDWILETAREEYDYILIDLKAGIFDEKSLFLITKSNEIHIVSTYDPLTIKDTGSFMNILKEFGVHEKKIKLLINRADCVVGDLNPESFEQSQYQMAFWAFPNDWFGCIESASKGMSIIEHAPKSKLAKEFKIFAEHYIKQESHT